MALTKRATAAAPYVTQLMSNSDVQASARQAALSTRAAYQRARGKDPREIVKHKKFRQRVSGALGQLWRASTEPPPQPKRRWPRLVLAAFVLAGAATMAATSEGVRARVLGLRRAGSTESTSPSPPETAANSQESR